MTLEQLDAMFETIGELKPLRAMRPRAWTRPNAANSARLHAETRQALQSSDVDAYDRLNQNCT